MRRTLVAMLAVLMSAPVSAQPLDWCRGLEPPLGISNPTPSVQFHIIDVPVEDLNFYCESTDTPAGWIAGCAAELGEGYWNIFLRNDLDDTERACAIDHEKAHLPPVLWDHGPVGVRVRGADGVSHLKVGPSFRRAAHLREWLFVSGRLGGKARSSKAHD